MTSFSNKVREKLNLEIRRMTFMLRAKPTLLIIGAQKAGTTSLYRYLAEHPDTGEAYRKEPRFYSHHYDKGLAWYRGNFPLSLTNNRFQVVFEASPSYILFPDAPQKIEHDFPSIKVIALLRHPIHRAYSQYEMNVRHLAIDEPRSFRDAITEEETRLQADKDDLAKDPTYHHKHFSYLARGHYWEQLARWYAVFPEENIKIIQAEALFQDTANIYGDVLDFLGLAPFEPAFDVWNASGSKMSIRDKIGGDLYEHLLDYFEPHNEILYKQIGQRFDWH